MMRMRFFMFFLSTIFFGIGYSQDVVASNDTIKKKEQPYVDFLVGKSHVVLTPQEKKVEGTVQYSFTITQPTSLIKVDAQKMQIGSVILDDTPINIDYDNSVISITSNFETGKTYTLAIEYTASPSKALYFVKDHNGKDQIWTQGQGKYTSNWLPSFDDMNEKVEFDLTIDFKKGYEVIANGKLVKNESVNDSIQRWVYDMQQPMSSYLVAFAIGKYDKKIETSSGNIPLEMYYHPDHEDQYASTYRYNKKIFDFLEKEIGYPYPWQNYKQIPVKDFLYAGMENTGTTIFSDAFMVDEVAFIDQNYINVNAHELAHQWFGNLVTATEGTHHWLQEGFATYYALLAEKEIFGEDYFLFKLYENAEQLTELSKSTKATSLLDSNASSLTFYQRGAWALHALRTLIGETSFRITVHNYLEKFRFSNVNTDDFMNVATAVSGMDLSDFRKAWLENVKFPSQRALDILTQSTFIKSYLTLAQERTQPIEGKWNTLLKSLDFPVNDYIGQEVVYQLEGITTPENIEIYNKAFETNNVFVRQAIANTLSTIPVDLQKQYESLLEDPSYATIEPALYNLWLNFPEKRKEYLEATEDIIGFTSKNVRILWLVLALNTQQFQTGNHQKFFLELSGYTSPTYGYNIRKNAFMYLESMKAFSDISLLDLVEGATHHNWRFRNSCRKILDKLILEEKYQKKYVALMDKLSKKQQDFLKNKLTP